MITKVESTPEGVITIETTTGYRKHFLGWPLRKALTIAQKESKEMQSKWKI